MVTSFFRKLKWLTERRKREALSEGLQFHLDEEAGEGADDEARWAARRDLGNVTLVEERTRVTRSWTFIEQLAQDLRYALRTMLQNRAFTGLAVLSLGLGIGANTAIYSFMDTLLLPSLPISDPRSRVTLNWARQRRQKRSRFRGARRERLFLQRSQDRENHRDFPLSRV